MNTFTIISLIIGVTLLYISSLMSNSKNYSIIAGYNNLSTIEKDKYGKRIAKDISSFFNTLGILNICACIISVIIKAVLPTKFDLMVICYISLLFAIVGLFILKRKHYPFMPAYLYIPLGTLFISLMIIIPYMYIKTVKTPQVLITNDSIKIESMYGQNIPIQNVKKIELMNTPPVIKKRLNGFLMGDCAKGKFTLTDGNIAYLYLVSNKSPFIRIVNKNNESIIINTESSQMTNKYYTQMTVCVEK